MKQEIYIKGEMPKSCWECPCFRNDLEQPCGLDNEDKGYFLDEIDGGECPLKSLADHDKQIRKEVVQEIKEQVVEATCYDTEEEARRFIYDLSSREILEILDRIEGGYNEKIN